MNEHINIEQLREFLVFRADGQDKKLEAVEEAVGDMIAPIATLTSKVNTITWIGGVLFVAIIAAISKILIG